MDVQITPVAAAAAGRMHRIPKRLGRGVPDISHFLFNTKHSKNCTCARQKTLVFCRGCGYYCHGRIRVMCPQHPRVTFLLDIAECPRCHSSTFLDEHKV